MAEALSPTQQRARSRADKGQQWIELAKDDIGEALEAFSALRGFSRHYARLERLHDEVRKLEKKIRAAVGKPLELTAQAAKEEEQRIERLAARVRADQLRTHSTAPKPQHKASRHKQRARKRDRQGVGRG